MPLPRKPAPQSRMLRLTPEQQEAAFAHCNAAPLRDAVHWLKAQFNLTISKSALGTWLQDQRIERSMHDELASLRENQRGATLVNEIAAAAAPITMANSVLFANAIFNEFRKPDGVRDENRLIRYMDLALKARDIEVRAAAVHIASERLRFLKSKPANCTDCITDPPDEAEKTDRAMALLFGEPPLSFKSESGLPVAEVENAKVPAANLLGAAACT